MAAQDDQAAVPAHSGGTRPKGIRMPDCRLTVSHADEDPEWDGYLEGTAGGDPVQTSLWAQVKAVTGWHCTRVVFRRHESIIAGAQLLTRRVAGVGTIGCALRLPLVSGDNLELWDAVIDAVLHQARSQHVMYLAMQPPGDGMAWSGRLVARGFGPSSLPLSTAATTSIDLTQHPEQIWMRLHKSVRRNIRRGQREGITVREGTADDLGIFYRLLLVSSAQGGFRPPPQAALQKLWDVLAPRGYARIFVAEYLGEPVSAHLAIAFGDTVLSKLSAWSGRHAKKRPNETLEWSVIQWAQAHGYRCYDLDGIDPRAAHAVLQDQPLPASLKQTPTSYKLGFGGDAVVFPPIYAWVPNPFLRTVSNAVFPLVGRMPVVARSLAGLR